MNSIITVTSYELCNTDNSSCIAKDKATIIMPDKIIDILVVIARNEK